MKAAIYNPYLDTLGGGERYTMAFAKVLAKEGFRVDVEWKDKSIKDKIENRFGIQIKELNFINDIKRGDGYDVCFWISDGSIPLLKARKNYLHFQVPFTKVNGKTLINKMKLIRMQEVISNSFFTKDFVDNEYGIKSVVIYPPVAIGKIRPKKKENIILYVGRFSQLIQSKRQDVLVRAFKNLCKSGQSKWQLVLAGGTEVGADKYLDRLEKASRGYPIEIMKSPSFKEIKDLYGRAKLFWSASGYGIDEAKEPEKVEHFGITVVEAMAAGAIPLVYEAGGHKEIIDDGMNGFLWKTQKNLRKKTLKLINDSTLVRKMSAKAKRDSLVYEYERFEGEVLQIL